MAESKIILKLKTHPRGFDYRQGEDVVWIGNDVSLEVKDIPQIVKFLKAVLEVKE